MVLGIILDRNMTIEHPRTQKLLLILLVIISVVTCKHETEAPMIDNPLLKEWTGPYGGVPAFDQMNVKDVKAAMQKGMELNLKEIDALTSNTSKPTFENTIQAMERSGKELERVFTYYWILRSNMSTPEFRSIQVELAPIIADFQSRIMLNKKLFQRIKFVYDASINNSLPEEQQRALELTYNRFAMNGAELDDKKKARYRTINKELLSLYTRFSNNLLHDEENYVTYLNENQLGGLSEGFIKSAARIASEKGQEGKYAITNTRSSMDPFLTYSTERGLREQVWTNYYSRGDNDDEYDNKKLISEILKLRRERVELFNYKNYASWRLQDRMAKTPENAMGLLEAIWPAAIARVAQEVEDMQAVANANGDNVIIAPWDYRYYAEKVRKEKYDLNSEEVKQYLQMGKLIEAMHYVAGRLFNYDFTQVSEGTVPVFHDDVKVWEVTDKTSHENIGLWYLDPYARDGKRSGAWANTYRGHSTFDGKQNVLASNNSNFVKPGPGEVSLVSWDDALTLFHEFGHALHSLSSTVKYPILNSGIRDYTEFHSQLLERWIFTDEVINTYLVHNKTGEPIPEALVAKIKKAATFNQGFSTTEYLASAIMDMKLHLTDPANIDVEKFERETLAELKMPKELPMRHRIPHFGHVFSGEGYATAYYGYIWADVLTADAAEAFAEAPGGFYDKEMAAKLIKYLFAPRNAMNPVEAYRLFRGRDANIDALMRARGFSVTTD
jgi:peptidyl-dipeptidase Dcp